MPTEADRLPAELETLLPPGLHAHCELRRLRQQCERLSLKTVEARLLHLLRTEGGAAGVPLGAGLKTLAREIGVTHEALYRCVAALERQGVLARHGGALRLQAPAARRTLA